MITDKVFWPLPEPRAYLHRETYPRFVTNKGLAIEAVIWEKNMMQNFILKQVDKKEKKKAKTASYH